MNSQNNISLDQIKAIRDYIPQTKEELRMWLILHLDVYLFDTPIDDGNSSPMDFVWDIYCKTVLNQVGDGKFKILGCAARGSQKTMSVAVAEFLGLLKDDKRDIIHLASIEAQSRVAYGYVQKYSRNPLFWEEKILSSIMTATKSHTGKSLVVTTGTLNSCNAHHGGNLVFDEVDLLPAKVFNEAHGMLTTHVGARGITTYISSRKVAFGNIQNLLDKSADPESNIAVHKWGLLEQAQTCLDERSGTDYVDYFVDEENLVALTEEEYKKVPDKKPYVKIKGFSGCAKCGIFSFCKTNLKKPKSPNPYYIMIDDVKRFFKSEDIDFFRAQRLNRKPSKTGLVFPTWDESIHLKQYHEIYELFTGDKHPHAEIYNDISKEELVKSFIESGCKLYVGIDWGFTSPFVALLVAVDGKENAYVIDHLRLQGQSDLECVEAIVARWSHLQVMLFPDTENPSGIKELRKAINRHQLKWHCSVSTEKDIDLGIGITRNFLRIPGTVKPRLFVHPSVAILRKEFSIYHYSIEKSTGLVLDKPEDEDNHSIDALRYVLASLFTKASSSLYSPALEEITAKERQPLQPLAPTIDAVAEKLGIDIGIMTEDDLKEKQEAEKKGYKGGGGGGFSWGF